MEMGKSRWPTRYYPRSNRECCVWQIATSMGMIFGKRPATQAPICSGESKRICVCPAVLGHLLDEQEPFPTALPCGCGHNAPLHAIRPRQLLTAVGPVTFDRAYYYCPRCHQGQVPRDRELDIVD